MKNIILILLAVIFVSCNPEDDINVSNTDCIEKIEQKQFLQYFDGTIGGKEYYFEEELYGHSGENGDWINNVTGNCGTATSSKFGNTNLGDILEFNLTVRWDMNTHTDCEQNPTHFQDTFDNRDFNFFNNNTNTEDISVARFLIKLRDNNGEEWPIADGETMSFNIDTIEKFCTNEIHLNQDGTSYWVVLKGRLQILGGITDVDADVQLIFGSQTLWN